MNEHQIMCTIVQGHLTMLKQKKSCEASSKEAFIDNLGTGSEKGKTKEKARPGKENVLNFKSEKEHKTLSKMRPKNAVGSNKRIKITIGDPNLEGDSSDDECVVVNGLNFECEKDNKTSSKDETKNYRW